MKISILEVKNIAHLARLELAEEDLILFTEQLNVIIEYMDRLNEIDTHGVAPTTHVLHIFNALRDDSPDESLNAKSSLANAPQKDKDFYLVPRVI